MVCPEARGCIYKAMNRSDLLRGSGCGRAEADFETSVFKISDNITKINVEHYVSGEIAQWAVEGAGVDDLRNWFNGLELYPF